MNDRTRLPACVVGIAFVIAPSLALASFDKDLRYGDRGAAVVALQQFLVEQGLLAPNLRTGNFLSRTLVAVKHLQAQQGISPISGFFGPLTRLRATYLSTTDRDPTSSLTFGAFPVTGFAPLRVSQASERAMISNGSRADHHHCSRCMSAPCHVRGLPGLRHTLLLCPDTRSHRLAARHPPTPTASPAHLPARTSDATSSHAARAYN